MAAIRAPIGGLKKSATISDVDVAAASCLAMPYCRQCELCVSFSRPGISEPTLKARPVNQNEQIIKYNDRKAYTLSQSSTAIPTQLVARLTKE